MNRIYCIIGRFHELTQLVELRLGEICEKSEIIKEFGRVNKMTESNYKQVIEDSAFLKEKMETMTFGQLIGTVYDSRSLNNEEVNNLRVLLGKRNYFAHEYFKYTNFVGVQEEFIVEEFEAIKEDYMKLKQIYNRLNIIKDNQETRINYLKKKNDIA